MGTARRRAPQSFVALATARREGVDFRIRYRLRPARFAIMAPHGGSIERGTSELAEAVAGDRYSFYAFEGLRPYRQNSCLHVSSNRFDEPRAERVACASDWVVTVHGAKGREPVVYAGGLAMELRGLVLEYLSAAGLRARDDPSPTRQGRKPNNICNRGRAGAGVQLEISYGMRRLMFAGLKPPQRRLRSAHFTAFVEALSAALEAYRPRRARY